MSMDQNTSVGDAMNDFTPFTSGNTAFLQRLRAGLYEFDNKRNKQSEKHMFRKLETPKYNAHWQNILFSEDVRTHYMMARDFNAVRLIPETDPADEPLQFKLFVVGELSKCKPGLYEFKTASGEKTLFRHAPVDKCFYRYQDSAAFSYSGMNERFVAFAPASNQDSTPIVADTTDNSQPVTVDLLNAADPGLYLFESDKGTRKIYQKTCFNVWHLYPDERVSYEPMYFVASRFTTFRQLTGDGPLVSLQPSHTSTVANPAREELRLRVQSVGFHFIESTEQLNGYQSGFYQFLLDTGRTRLFYHASPGTLERRWLSDARECTNAAMVNEYIGVREIDPSSATKTPIPKSDYQKRSVFQGEADLAQQLFKADAEIERLNLIAADTHDAVHRTGESWSTAFERAKAEYERNLSYLQGLIQELELSRNALNHRLDEAQRENATLISAKSSQQSEIIRLTEVLKGKQPAASPNTIQQLESANLRLGSECSRLIAINKKNRKRLAKLRKHSQRLFEHGKQLRALLDGLQRENFLFGEFNPGIQASIPVFSDIKFSEADPRKASVVIEEKLAEASEPSLTWVRIQGVEHLNKLNPARYLLNPYTAGPAPTIEVIVEKRPGIGWFMMPENRYIATEYICDKYHAIKKVPNPVGPWGRIENVDFLNSLGPGHYIFQYSGPQSSTHPYVKRTDGMWYPRGGHNIVPVSYLATRYYSVRANSVRADVDTPAEHVNPNDGFSPLLSSQQLRDCETGDYEFKRHASDDVKHAHKDLAGVWKVDGYTQPKPPAWIAKTYSFMRSQPKPINADEPFSLTIKIGENEFCARMQKHTDASAKTVDPRKWELIINADFLNERPSGRYTLVRRSDGKEVEAFRRTNFGWFIGTSTRLYSSQEILTTFSHIALSQQTGNDIWKRKESSSKSATADWECITGLDHLQNLPTDREFELLEKATGNIVKTRYREHLGWCIDKEFGNNFSIYDAGYILHKFSHIRPAQIEHRLMLMSKRRQTLG